MTEAHRSTSANSRDRIFDEAAKQFRESGYRATTNVTIANAIDVAPTLINHFFKSKAGLYREIFGHDPLSEDDGRYFAMILSAIRTAAEIGDPILSDPTFVAMLGGILDERGIPRVGFSPQQDGEDGSAYIARQFRGLSQATSETPSCDICSGFFWKTDRVAQDIDLGITHLICNSGSPVVSMETGEEIPGATLDSASFEYGEGGL